MKRRYQPIGMNLWKLVSQESWSDRRMKNTFGWARIDIVTMLVCFVFLASFCFSILMEALQTLVHIDHLDEMHHPLAVLCIGASGILLNAVCYILIGGFTFNQGIFLHVTKSGDVILCRRVSWLQLQSRRRYFFLHELSVPSYNFSYDWSHLYKSRPLILIIFDVSEMWVHKRQRMANNNCQRKPDEVRWRYRKAKVFEKHAVTFSAACLLYWCRSWFISPIPELPNTLTRSLPLFHRSPCLSCVTHTVSIFSLIDLYNSILKY